MPLEMESVPSRKTPKIGNVSWLLITWNCKEWTKNYRFMGCCTWPYCNVKGARPVVTTHSIWGGKHWRPFLVFDSVFDDSQKCPVSKLKRTPTLDFDCLSTYYSLCCELFEDCYPRGHQHGRWSKTYHHQQMRTPEEAARGRLKSLGAGGHTLAVEEGSPWFVQSLL